jgi:hypothetical protein
MIKTFTLFDVCAVIITIGIVYLMYELFNRVIFPWIVNKRTKDIEKNPKWIIPELQEKYYGFRDIDIITVDSPLGLIPRFRVDKKQKNRLQLLIPVDTSVRDIDDIARLALAGKIKIKYGLWFPDKSAHWLAILNFMLDGGDIRIDATKWEKDK